MAVLKDLIVHGPSRFINPAYFTDLKSESLYATNGVFNYLKATTGDIESLSVEDLKAQRATVAVRLDVEGELHTNSWTASNISTIDGAFYITPTVSCDSGTFNYDGSAITVTAASGYSFGIDDLYMGGSTTALTASWWTQYSYVIITGDVLDETNNEWKPLGTIRGRINSASTSSIKINNLTDNKGSSSIITLTDIGTGNKTFRKVKVSLYKRATSSTVDYPIGIYMTALATKGKTFLDIYGGSEQTGLNITNTIGSVTHSSGALAKPKVRIGNLLGLPKVGGIDPTGWGIYTNNGFFEGTIVATQGKIGGANGWTIAENILYSGSHSTYNASNAGIFLGKVSNDFYVAGGNGAMWYLKSNGDAKIGDMTYTNGTLSVPAAKITGQLTASQLAANSVTAEKLDATTINTSNKLTVGAMTTDAANLILNSKVKVGGRNLALESNTVWDSTAYNVIQGTLSEDWIAGETYTIQIKGTPSSGKKFGLWRDTGSAHMCYFNEQVNGIWTTTAVCPAPASGATDFNKFSIYDYDSTGDHSAHIDWIKIEKGNKATDWSPAPEDITTGIEDAIDPYDNIINGDEESEGLQQIVERLANFIIIDPDEPSITIQTINKSEGEGNPTSASVKITDTKQSFSKNGIEVMYLDSGENDGSLDINNVIIHDSIRIGGLEIFDNNGNIAIRGRE